MTPTPRTDEVLDKYYETGYEYVDISPFQKLGRELETELADMTQQRDHLLASVKRFDVTSNLKPRSST